VTLDPITFEVIRSTLLLAVQEMKQVAMRTAYSPLWKEAGDMSCGILTATGELVAQGPADIPVHLGSMPLSMQGILDALDPATFEDGDVILHNDPYQGNNHLPDTIMAKPVIVDGEVLAYTAVRGHYIDIGGFRPGSYSPLARDLFGEGLRIPPVKLYRRGDPDPDLMRMLAANTRMPQDLLGDVRAQFAGCVAGERRLQATVTKYGRAVVLEGMQAVLDHGERLMRAEIDRLRPGVYRFTDACDDDGFNDEPIVISAAITVGRGRIAVDFAGSSPQVPTYMNAPPAVTASATYYAVKCFVAPDDPPSSGAYRAIEISAPPGTVVNPLAPAPVAAGNHETAARIFDVVLGALAQADPSRAVAAGCGTSCGYHLTARGLDDEGEPVTSRTWIEIHGAGRGAGHDYDGAHALPVFGNTSNTPVEHIEMKYPVRVERLEIAQDSGGAGRWRGGSAIRRRFRLLADHAFLTVLSERGRIPPYSLMGGRPGKTARAYLWEHGVLEEQRYRPSAQIGDEDDGPGLQAAAEGGTRIRTKLNAFEVERGVMLQIQGAGGGGYGDPLLRDPDAVRRDVFDGYVSHEAAAREYGVALLPTADHDLTGDYVIDQQATSLLRSSRTEAAR
jgi:N-methylhydantoinase B